jgi:hypothetical protein
MKAQSKAFRIQYDSQMMPEIVLSLTSRECLNHLEDIKTATDKGKALDVEIKPHRERRSLDANGMMWAVLQQMAEVLHTSKEEVYLQMLKKYGGKFAYIVVQPEAVETLKSVWREVEEVGKGEINGKECIQLLCYYGSSTYNTKEFSVLLDGILSDAEEIGIQVISQAEMSLLIKERS